MSATVEISESNGASETVTDGITNSNMGNVDAPNLDPATYPVTPGERTYAKYQRLHVVSMGGSTSIQNIKVWRTGDLGGSATHVTNARTSGYVQISYSQPTKQAISGVDQPMPTSAPASANLGINGALDGKLTAPGYSDYLVHQIVTDPNDTSGSTTTLNFQYDEIA